MCHCMRVKHKNNKQHCTFYDDFLPLDNAMKLKDLSFQQEKMKLLLFPKDMYIFYIFYFIIATLKKCSYLTFFKIDKDNMRKLLLN